MNDTLHLPPRHGAPVACDMRRAADTPDQRLGEYQRLFQRALASRERRPDGVVLRFRADPGVRAAVESLARREAACCPFLDYHVETANGEVIWTTTNPLAGEERAAVDVYLDAFHDLSDHVDPDITGLFERLAARGVEIDAAAGDRLELRPRS